MELQCSVCDTQLSPAFEGRAEARDWDENSLVCAEHFDDVQGARLVPEA